MLSVSHCRNILFQPKPHMILACRCKPTPVVLYLCELRELRIEVNLYSSPSLDSYSFKPKQRLQWYSVATGVWWGEKAQHYMITIYIANVGDRPVCVKCQCSIYCKRMAVYISSMLSQSRIKPTRFFALLIHTP